MERNQVVILAVAVAALALFGLRQLSDDTRGVNPVATGAASEMLGARVPAGSSRKLPRSGNPPGRPGHETRNADGGQPDAPADDPGSPRRGARRHGADVIGGLPREHGAVGSAVGGDPGGVGADEIALAANGPIAGGKGLVPSRGGGRDIQLPAADPNKRQVFEFVDDDPANAAKDGDDDVLLSVPFKGDVESDAGGGPTHAEGLVVDGGEIEFTEDAIVTFPADGHVNGEAGTISFEIQPDWAGADETNNSLVQIRNEHMWENRLQIVKNFDSLRFIFVDNSGQERNVNVYINDWQAGEAHRISATWGDASMALYVDGGLVGQNTYPGQFEVLPSTPIFIGSDFPGASYAGAGGRIRDFKVWGRVLGPDELARR